MPAWLKALGLTVVGVIVAMIVYDKVVRGRI